MVLQVDPAGQHSGADELYSVSRQRAVGAAARFLSSTKRLVALHECSETALLQLG